MSEPTKKQKRKKRLTAEDVLLAVMKTRLADLEEEARRIREDRQRWGPA